MPKLEEWTPETLPARLLEDRLAEALLGARVDHTFTHKDDTGEYAAIAFDNGMTMYFDDCWLGFPNG